MADETNALKNQKRREGRSPAYPFVPVLKALDRAQELYAQEGSHNAPLSSTLGAWGYSAKSSGGRQTLATMRYYGLIEVTGEGDARMVKLSEIARKILLDKREDDREKRALIREVALMPSAHKMIYQKYPDGLPSDGTVHHYLVFERGFNDDGAKEVISEFKQTALQVDLYQPRNDIDKFDELPDDASVKNLPEVKVGDMVQATIAGSDIFPNGARVLGFSEDRAWVFTDQSDSAIRIEEVTLIDSVAKAPVNSEERPSVPAHLLKRKTDEQPKGTRKAVFPLDEGDVSLIFPEGISAEGLEELGAYLQIFLKKEIKKSNSG